MYHVIFALLLLPALWVLSVCYHAIENWGAETQLEREFKQRRKRERQQEQRALTQQAEIEHYLYQLHRRRKRK